MPYSGPNDDKLPENVKKMPAKGRAAWVRIWNSAYARCQSKGGNECEANAFKIANAMVKKVLAQLEEEGELTMTDDAALFYVELAQLVSGKAFDAMVPGSFIDMLGREVVFADADLAVYVKNTQTAIEATRGESGEVAGLPIDAQGHDKGDGAGWIVGVSLEGGKVRLIPKWTEIGLELISKGIRRFFSPTVDTAQKVILGGSLTNWPATRNRQGHVLLRPVELSQEGLMVVETLEDDPQVLEDEIEDVDEEVSDPSRVERALQEMRSLWQRIEKFFLGADEDDGELADADFDLSPWDAAKATSGKDIGFLRAIHLLDLNEPGREGGPIAGNFKLPYKYTPQSKPNKAAIRAIGGGARGISQVAKPPDCSQSRFDAQMKAAANRVISWWKSAFDNDAPQAVYRIAGKSRPAEQSLEDIQEVLTMDVTKEELQDLIAAQVKDGLGNALKEALAELQQGQPQPEGEGEGEGESKFDVLKFLEMEGTGDEFVTAFKSAMVEMYDQTRAKAAQEAAQMIAQVRREAHVAEFAARITGGTEETPRGIAVDAETLKKFILSLDAEQAAFIQPLLEKVVEGGGLVEFEEMGHSKKQKGAVPVPEYVSTKLDSGELKIVDLSDPILGLGDVSQYDLSKWQ